MLTLFHLWKQKKNQTELGLVNKVVEEQLYVVFGQKLLLHKYGLNVLEHWRQFPAT